MTISLHVLLSSTVNVDATALFYRVAQIKLHQEICSRYLSKQAVGGRPPRHAPAGLPLLPVVGAEALCAAEQTQHSSSFPWPRFNAHRCSRLMRQNGGEQSGLVTLTFDLLTLKVVSQSRLTWATSLPILVFLGLSVPDLVPITRQTDVRLGACTGLGLTEIPALPRDSHRFAFIHCRNPARVGFNVTEIQRVWNGSLAGIARC